VTALADKLRSFVTGYMADSTTQPVRSAVVDKRLLMTNGWLLLSLPCELAESLPDSVETAPDHLIEAMLQLATAHDSAQPLDLVAFREWLPEPPSNPIVTCSECEGSGCGTACQDCGGSGEIRCECECGAVSHTIPCADCDASGRYRCDDCEGVGTVREYATRVARIGQHCYDVTGLAGALALMPDGACTIAQPDDSAQTLRLRFAEPFALASARRRDEREDMPAWEMRQ